MPFYDLRCTKCEKEFNLMATMTEKTEGRILCPECNTATMETLYKAAPYVIKGGSAPECPNSHVCGAGCRHAG